MVGNGKTSHRPPKAYTSSPGSGLRPGWKQLFEKPSTGCTPPFSATTSYTNDCRLGVAKRDLHLGSAGRDLPQHVITSVP